VSKSTLEILFESEAFRTPYPLRGIVYLLSPICLVQITAGHVEIAFVKSDHLVTSINATEISDTRPQESL
jgi:hypothetical protein